MKLLNYTSGYFSIILMIVIPIWAGLFYVAMLDEVYDSMDDGLDNQRQLIISKATNDSTVLKKDAFEEGNYSILPISPTEAQMHKDIYVDTLMYMNNEKDFEPVRMLQTVFRKGENYYQMRVITSMVEEDDLINQLTRALLLLYFGLILTIIFLNNFLLRNIWKPFYQLTRQLQDFKLNKVQSIEGSKTKIDEFNLMQESVQRFLANNVAAFNSQKQFIENASHELQTPLAIALNKLELLAENRELDAAQAELLASAISNLERLKRLNQSLLLLSKIENEQFNGQVSVDINTLTKKLLGDFAGQVEFYNLELNYEETGTCSWKINPDLGDILLTNLIKNAIKHSPKDSNIIILIEPDGFTIKNEGESALDQEQIFQRFFKESTSPESAGLGLAISKAIASVTGLKLTYHYDAKHVFTVRSDS